MIQSMTAFARSQKQIDEGVFYWEIRSVNHRYLDISFRLPESFRSLEPDLRALVRNHLSRGKLECQLKFQDTSSDNQSMLINIGMVNALLDISGQLAASHQIANDMTVSRVLSWPGTVQMQQPDMEQLSEVALALFDEGLNQLVQSRSVEGAGLKAHLEGRLQALLQEVGKCRTIESDLAQQNKERLLARLEAVKIEVAEARIEQELALILARLDVSEELDRLDTHCAEVSRTINCDKVAGRRLDFLMQELNREANTLSSKSDSVELTQSALQMKVLIEQMREQIQNIE